MENSSESNPKRVESDEDEEETLPPVLPEPLTIESPPEGVFFIEVIKNGQVIQRQPVNTNRLTFGRSRDADFPMDHPSVSRIHACLLWNPITGPDGSFLLIDLRSVHGTFLNKTKMEPCKPYKISAGNLIKIGGSSRLFFISTSRSDDLAEDCSEESLDSSPPKSSSKPDEKEGCNWGISDDYAGDDDPTSSDYFTPLGTVLSLLQTGIGPGPTNNENAYVGNPQKSLQSWFEAEGYDFEYKMDYINGKFKCSLDLPIDGQNVTIESEMNLKKRDAIHGACLKACQILDKSDLLFPWQGQKEVRKRADGSSDSDDDLLDETDQYKHKKAKKEAIRKGTVQVHNYETLKEKWQDLSKELTSLKAKLASLKVKKVKVSDESQVKNEEEDALDEFMKSIEGPDVTKSALEVKIQKSKLQMEIINLEKEQRKVEKMMDIAKPSASLPALKATAKSFNAKSVLEEKLKQMKSSKPSPDKTIVIKEESYSSKNFAKETPHKSISTSNEEKIHVPSSDSKVKIGLTLTKKAGNVGKVAELFKNKIDETNSKPTMSPIPQPPTEKQFGLIIKKDPNKKPKQSLANSTGSTSFGPSEDYVEWLPPEDQQGDGSTSLNEKFGY